MNIKRALRNCIAVIMIAGFFFACKKPAGEGGKSSIRGKVWIEDWNVAYTVKNSDYAAYDEDVYIVYGDNVGYSDKTKTDYNGDFEFKYLRKGKYRVYVYSKDKTLTSPSGEVSVVKEVEITSKKGVNDIGTLIIYK